MKVGSTSCCKVQATEYVSIVHLLTFFTEVHLLILMLGGTDEINGRRTKFYGTEQSNMPLLKQWNTYLSSLGTKECFETENLLDGSPSPSNRTSSPPMLLKWFCARVFSDIVDLRAYKVIKWSDKSVHWSFKFSLRMTLKSSATNNFR